MFACLLRAETFILTSSLLIYSIESQDVRTFSSLQSTLNNSVLCIASPASSTTPAKSPMDCARQCVRRGWQCKIASYRSWPSGYCDMYYYSPWLYQPRANCSSFRVRCFWLIKESFNCNGSKTRPISSRNSGVSSYGALGHVPPKPPTGRFFEALNNSV